MGGSEPRRSGRSIALPRLWAWRGGHGPLRCPPVWSSGEGRLQLEGETAGLSVGGGEGSRPCPEGSGVQGRHPRDAGALLRGGGTRRSLGPGRGFHERAAHPLPGAAL